MPISHGAPSTGPCGGSSTTVMLIFSPRILRHVKLLFGLAMVIATATAGAADAPLVGVEFFEKNVRPLLVERCYECHSTQSKKVKGKLLLDTREGLLKGGETGPAVVPGDVEKSLLIQAVRYSHEDLQ